LRSPLARPELSVRAGSELQLSSAALADLMKNVLARGLPFRFRVRGWSMTPFIRDRDVVTIVPLESKPPRIGDIVAFAGPGIGPLVVHRVVGRSGTRLLIQGDNQAEAPDGLLPESSVLGRVSRVERDGRQVRLGLGGERGLLALLSRKGLLSPLVDWARVLVSRLRRGKTE